MLKTFQSMNISSHLPPHPLRRVLIAFACTAAVAGLTAAPQRTSLGLKTFASDEDKEVTP